MAFKDYCTRCNTWHSEKEGHVTFDIPRERLREMGVPCDMTADDVIAFFDLPDDDLMHQQAPPAPPAPPAPRS